RRTGLAYQTERSYVSKIGFFMRERGPRNLRDFDRIAARDVEAHLTDLAFDENVVLVADLDRCVLCSQQCAFAPSELR
ncbi:MAG: hypothetical protein AAFN70_17165, partial [Planctomycetota bacterium]